MGSPAGGNEQSGTTESKQSRIDLDYGDIKFPAAAGGRYMSPITSKSMTRFQGIHNIYCNNKHIKTIKARDSKLQFKWRQEAAEHKSKISRNLSEKGERAISASRGVTL